MTSSQDTREYTNDLLSYIDNIEVDNDGEVKSPSVSKDSSSHNSYNEEWRNLFNNINDHSIRKLGIYGKLRSCRYRSIVWKYYLGILSKQSDKWIEEVETKRKSYSEIKQKFIIDPRTIESKADDPLSLNDESKWNQYFKSQETMKEIKQDVVRTFPDMEFFLKSSVRENMINILYCYTQSLEIPYKQGMHEILAPLLFVIHSDHLAHEHILEILASTPSQIALDTVTTWLLDSRYLEHDAFSIFIEIMHIIQPWYDIQPGVSTHNFPSLASVSSAKINFLKNLRPFEKPKESLPECFLGCKVQRIQDNILKQHDLEVYLHLEKLDISHQLFGFRWLKLLFGREFTMQDLLIVWDLIFATCVLRYESSGVDVVGVEFVIVDYLYVAMLLHIRDILLTSDYATCLTTLMSYPKNADVNRVIESALYLYKPDVYARPIERAVFRGADLTKQLQLQQQTSLDRNHLSVRQRKARRNKTIVGIENFIASITPKKSPGTNITSSASFHNGDFNHYTTHNNNLDNDSETVNESLRSKPRRSKAPRPISLYQDAAQHSDQWDSAPLTPTNQRHVQQSLLTNQSQPTPEITNDFVDISITTSDSLIMSNNNNAYSPGQLPNRNSGHNNHEKHKQAAHAAIKLLNQSLIKLRSTTINNNSSSNSAGSGAGGISQQNLEIGINYINKARDVLRIEILNAPITNNNNTVHSLPRSHYKKVGVPSIHATNSGAGGGAAANKLPYSLSSSSTLHRSVSSNDIVNLMKLRARYYNDDDNETNSQNFLNNTTVTPSNSNTDLLSDKLMKLFPAYTKSHQKEVEMKDISKTN